MRTSPLRVGLLIVLVLAPASAAWWFCAGALQAWAAVAAPGPGRVDTVVVASAATAGAAVAGWLALGAAVTGVLVLAGSSRRATLVPAGLHRAVALVLGVALVATTAPSPAPSSPVPAATSESATPDPAWTPTSALPGTPAAAPVRAGPAGTGHVHVLDPGWRPTTAPAAAPRTVAEPIDPILLTGPRSPVGAAPEPVTVRRGDTLWDLAARHLGAGATDAEIAVEWPRWYAANREAVGADPDLLVPGQQLAPPERANGG